MTLSQKFEMGLIDYNIVQLSFVSEKNQQDILLLNKFCGQKWRGTAISHLKHLKHEELTQKNIPRSAAASSCHLVPQVPSGRCEIRRSANQKRSKGKNTHRELFIGHTGNLKKHMKMMMQMWAWLGTLLLFHRTSKER